jgi:hypothetical protein
MGQAAAAMLRTKAVAAASKSPAARRTTNFDDISHPFSCRHSFGSRDWAAAFELNCEHMSSSPSRVPVFFTLDPKI